MKHDRILIVFPHPDDEAYSTSGTLAKYIHEGAQVTYACLTLGEMGRNMGVPPFANRVTLPAVRKLELEESCRAIGIQDVRLLGFHDKMVEFEPHAKLDAPIAAIIEELRPSLVITFYPGYSVHPDHDACGEAVVRIIGAMPKEKRPVVYGIAFSKNHQEAIGSPDVFEDVKPFLKAKLASISAHRSQFPPPEGTGDKKLSYKELEERFGMERFWTYRFN
jgi:bacillithiol biosynthesis deacetylase BshB2